MRNLPHIAGMAFNEPLMLEPAYARVFFCALASRMGVSQLTDASGKILGPGQINEELAAFDDEREQTMRPYQVVDRIAIIPVAGTLVNKSAYLQPYSGMTGYNGIVSRLYQAVSDIDVDGILLDMDTPGGMVAGAFDCADTIARLRESKPIWALANDMNTSAGQLIASAANRRLVTQTAKTGSIGVLMAHRDYSAAMGQAGIEITLIHSGRHKVDGNPYEKLPEDVRKSIQSQIDATRQMFAEKVASYTGLSVQAIMATEAAVYSGAEALDMGLADEMVNNTEAVSVMKAALNKRSRITTGGTMAAENTNTEAAATKNEPVNVAPENNAGAAAAGVTQINPQQGNDEQVAAAVAAENARIMGILGCDEAKGRESMAQALASTLGMTVEDAQRIMSAAPLSAQARSETSLDTMMESAPAAVSAAAGNGSDDDDLAELLSTPV